MPLPFQRVIRPKFYWVTASRRRKFVFLPINFTTLRVSLELAERGFTEGDKTVRVFQEVSGLEMGMGMGMWLE
ncbi:hypothetical protein CEXT_381131 [Caerostris extrusa]|uniref:Uncharacterized protein n=1 Tax=Caerostris extrusa TaxID=172846 RepID=A0AAV4SJR2_CAEEX|nr:hypothetical protein CEXT_381131 [Caerostris extrusa]